MHRWWSRKARRRQRRRPGCEQSSGGSRAWRRQQQRAAAAGSARRCTERRHRRQPSGSSWRPVPGLSRRPGRRPSLHRRSHQPRRGGRALGGKPGCGWRIFLAQRLADRQSADQRSAHVLRTAGARHLRASSERLSLVAVTGTNGKTSVTQWIGSTHPRRCPIIGTLGAGLPGQLLETGSPLPRRQR